MNLKDNAPFQGRSEFELRRNAFLDRGKEALLKDGAIEDAILRAELGGATRDLRCGTPNEYLHSESIAHQPPSGITA